MKYIRIVISTEQENIVFQRDFEAYPLLQKLLAQFFNTLLLNNVLQVYDLYSPFVLLQYANTSNAETSEHIRLHLDPAQFQTESSPQLQIWHDQPPEVDRPVKLLVLGIYVIERQKMYYKAISTRKAASSLLKLIEPASSRLNHLLTKKLSFYVYDDEQAEASSASAGPPSVELLHDEITMPEFATRTLDTYQLQEIVGSPDRQASPIILVSRQALEEMQEIARADSQVEQGGTLIGNIYERGDGPGYLIEITNHIYAKDAQGTHTQLRYTVESWLQRKALMVEQFADKRIVGWYHTHPLHQLSAYKEEPYYHHDALFFSQDDIFIHSQFFQERWYVALVLNTLGQPAFFCWTDNTIVKAAGFFIVK